MRHSKEGVQGLVATFDGGEGGVDGQQWLNLADLDIFWLQWEGEGCLG